jgi:hypothetical protein
MATVSQVEDALATLITAALYPNGAPPSVLAYPVKIYPGWPDPATLDTDMVETAPGVPTAAHVSIYPLPAGRNTTRFPAERVETPAPAKTYTLTAVGQVITVGGAAPNPYVVQNLAAFVGGKPYVVGAAAGNTPTALATALAALIAADVAGVTRVGPAITIPAGVQIGALRVGSTGSTSKEVRRQEKQYQISAWSSNPASRAAVSDAYDAKLSDTPRLTLADGSVARLTYHGQRDDDFAQKQRIYRRSLIFTVEYATTLIEAAPEMVAGEVDSASTDGTQFPTTYS